MARDNSQNSIHEDEIAGTTQPASSASPPRNAFSTLMNRKRAAPPSSPPNTKKKHSSNGWVNRRDGLAAYTQNPESYSHKVVIYHNEDVVAIHDLYPKSSVHTLLLPRSEKHTLQHPFNAFEDAEFLAMVQKETKVLRRLVSKELQRKYGPVSKQDEAREAVLNGDVELADGEDLPQGRDWEKEVRAGIHAHPSMNHLHIHIMSVDRHSECLKSKKHYNSFATDFFVPIEDFPLKEDDDRRHPGREGYLKGDMKCWRCGKNFTNQFAKLKEHLKLEFEEWKRE